MNRADAGRARLLLLALTTLWGSTFVVIHTGVDLISPVVLISVRFGIAAVVLGLARPRSLRALPDVLLPALPLSITAVASFSLQAEGLLSTTPARSAFLTSLSVVFVPVLEWIRNREAPRGRIAVAVGLATLGIWVLFRPLGLEWHRGDTLTLLASVFFAFYISELGAKSRRYDEVDLVFTQCLTVAVLGAFIAPFVEEIRFVIDPVSIGAVVYLGVVCTALVFLMMAWAQARVAAVEAAVIYTLEPVVAAVISVAIGREPLTAKLAIGGSLVVIAMGLAGSGVDEPRPPEGID